MTQRHLIKRATLAHRVGTALLMAMAGTFAADEAGVQVTRQQLRATMAPELIIFNAIVHTVDPKQPLAEAVAISGNRIAAVGSDQEIKPLVAANTHLIDGRRQLVLPGFNDAHVHFLAGGFQLSSVDLRDASTPEAMAQRIGKFAATLASGRWITGGDWGHERWPTNSLPTRQLIDPLTPQTPVFVTRLDGHMALANTLALKLAGLSRETRDPEGGLIVRDPKTGELTGVLKDAAMGLVSMVIPPASIDEK